MRTVYAISMWKDAAVRERVRAMAAGLGGCEFGRGGELVVDEAAGDVAAVVVALRSLGFVNEAGVAPADLAGVRAPLFEVARRREYSESDRSAAAWLWDGSGIECLIVGELRCGPDGRLRGRDVRVRRSAQVMGRADCELIVSDVVREHVDSIGLRGIEWREGVGRRCPLWEAVPRRELPRMPAGAVRRSWRDGRWESEQHPEGGRYGAIYEPGFSDGVQAYPREVIEALGDVDMAATWEHEWAEEHSPFLVVSQRFYREVLRRFFADGECRPVRVIEHALV